MFHLNQLSCRLIHVISFHILPPLELRELQTAHATAFSSLEASHRQAISAKESSHLQAIEELRAELDAQKSAAELQSRHRQAVEDVETRLGQELREAHDRIEKQLKEQTALQAALTAQKDEVIRITQEQQQQQQQQEDDKEKQIAREKEAQERHERAVASVASLETDKQRLQEQLSQLTIQTTSLTAEIDSMKRLHEEQGLFKQKELDGLRQELESTFDDRLAAALASQQKLHDEAFASSHAAHGKKMDEVID